MAKGVKQGWRAWFTPEVRYPDDRGIEVAIDPHPTPPTVAELDEAEREAGAPDLTDEPKRPLWKRAIETPAAMVVGTIVISLMVAIPGGLLFLVWKCASALARAAGLSGLMGIPIAIGGIMCLAAFWPWTFGKWLRKAGVRSTVVRHASSGFCAACGYGLGEVEAEPDGCRVCPECGAAWNVDAWRRDYPPIVVRWNECPDGAPDKRLTVADARGLSMPVMLHRTCADVAEEVRRCTRRTPWRIRKGVPWGVVGVALLCLLPLGIDAMVAWVVVLCLSAASIAVAWLAMRTDRVNRATRMLAAEVSIAGSCPSCETKLAEVPARDGALVCERCGGAWWSTREE